MIALVGSAATLTKGCELTSSCRLADRTGPSDDSPGGLIHLMQYAVFNLT